MPAASCPGQDTTRRLMSRGWLSRAKAERRRLPRLERWCRTWRYGTDRERTGGPLRDRIPARRTRANRHPMPSAPAPGASGKASPKTSHAACARSARRAGAKFRRNSAGPDRNAAPAQGENGALSPKNTEARRPTEPFEPAAEQGQGRDPATAAEPRSRCRDRHSPVRRLPRGPPPPNPGPKAHAREMVHAGATIRRFRVARKPCAIQENGQAGIS